LELELELAEDGDADVAGGGEVSGAAAEVREAAPFDVSAFVIFFTLLEVDVPFADTLGRPLARTASFPMLFCFVWRKKKEKKKKKKKKS
jgi:hypothetical protein